MSPVRRGGALALVLGLALSGCASATPRTAAEMDVAYRPVVAEIRDAVGQQVPGVTWQPVEVRALGGKECEVRVSVMGRAPSLVRPSDGLLQAVNGPLARHGFRTQKKIGDDPGGWLVLSSTDRSGAELEYRSKAEVSITVKAPGAPGTC